MFLLCINNTLSRFVIAFLPGSKHLLISWLKPLSMVMVILEPKKIKSVTASTFFTFYLPWIDGTGCHNLIFVMLSFKSAFSFSSFTLIKRLFSSSSLSAIRVILSAYLRCWYFSRQFWFQLVIHPVLHFPWCTLHCYYCCCLVTRLCPAVCDLIDCNAPGSSVLEISQAKILK